MARQFKMEIRQSSGQLFQVYFTSHTNNVVDCGRPESVRKSLGVHSFHTL